MSRVLRFILLALPVASIWVSAAASGTLEIRVVDGITEQPLEGAFVQVGEAPGIPFPGNWGWTGEDGRIVFSDPGLIGPQTVTAGFEGYALLTVTGAVEETFTAPLRAEVAPSGVVGPRAEIYGTTSGIQTQSNDGNIDLGFVYPAIRLADILSSQTLPFEVPPDTVDFPLIGEVVLPGNVAIPSQTEFFIYNFSKPSYHFFVPDETVYDIIVLAGRIPIEELAGGSDPLNAVTMREMGAEREIQISGDTQVPVDADLDLSVSLTVDMAEALAGSEIFAAVVADLQAAGAARTIFFDAKSVARDLTSQLLLSGRNPSGDIADAVPYLAGFYTDTVSGAWEAGRVDRGPLTFPSERTLDGFFLIPDLSQVGEEFIWTDVARPGVTPDPTWALARFRIEAEASGDTTVTPRTPWEIWVRAEARSFRLPILAEGAPGGLPDPAQTPEADRLIWDHWVADPDGGIGDLVDDAFLTLTRWSRCSIEVTPPVVVVDEVGLGTLRHLDLGFRLVPNPGRAVRDIVWTQPPTAGNPVFWTVWDPSGRRVAGGTFLAGGTLVDRSVLTEVDSLPTGVYWVRLEAGIRAGTRPLVVVR